MVRRNAWGDAPVKPSDVDVQPMMGGQPPGLGLSIKKPQAQINEEEYFSKEEKIQALFNKKRQAEINRLAELKPSSSRKPAKNIFKNEFLTRYNEANEYVFENVIPIGNNINEALFEQQTPENWQRTRRRLLRNIRQVEPYRGKRSRTNHYQRENNAKRGKTRRRAKGGLRLY